jgi:hypothetical protein
MMSYKTIFYIPVILILNSGCAVYKARSPIVEGHFPGIIKDVEDNNIKDIRVFIIHGIGRQKITYSQEFIELLTDNLSDKRKQLLFYDTIDYGKDQGKVIINRYRVNNKYVTFYSLYWSEITEKYKSLIDKNHNELYDQFGVKRAKVNDRIKKMVTNDGFVDFILYASGSFKNEIREPVKKTLDLIYNDSDSIEIYLKRNDFAAMQSIPVYDKSIYLITGSLGSKIVLDVLADFKVEAGIVDDFKSRRHRFYYEKLKSIFMLTNQVPLLSLLYAPNDTVQNDTMQYIYQNYYGLCNFLQRSENSMLNYVSFYDPNDLLGFNPISNPPVCLGENHCNNCSQRINRSRVVLRNARPFKFMFARPAKAHMGVWKNKKLIKLISDGT